MVYYYYFWCFLDLHVSGRWFVKGYKGSDLEMQACIEKKYGGIVPKKPLISKDHERAYFDSADWVLGKQGANSSSSKAAVETLKPKLKVQ
ncbi:hypothetical protein E2562_001336 [Oryza meyeriana var. granulata]|uniref:Negatively light-regulated protein n=1 Tax=Oryza meyeriana var. granulata TaxID=110450 RepID=A0A6G1DBN0_9ORYZ|nr:hypothetical protein E2562_001336 [Oryza meyeriana var. granulata]KAF0910108.1 hypothetical protein E2562_001336 [Oryza meyeriana var. granulata]